MSINESENYSQDGQSFQNDGYKDDNSVSNVLDNSINNDPEQDYKDADDLDPDDYEEDLDEDLDEDFEDDEENNSDEINLDNDINETDYTNRPTEF